VPAYLLARRLGLGRPLALAGTALTLAAPSLFYSSWVMGEPFAYPLVLAAAYAATVALADRSRRAGLAFVALPGLAAFSRAQFTVLPVCFLVSLLLVGLRGRSLGRELRAQALPLALFAVPVALLVALPHRRPRTGPRPEDGRDVERARHPASLQGGSGRLLAVT
jgi:hypothetical protein